MADARNPSSAVVELVLSLAAKSDIRSISCQWSDEMFWRRLVAVQLTRARAAGVAPYRALAIAGPDSEQPFDVFDWGGQVHFPWEGAIDADVFVNPAWRAVRTGSAYNGGGIFGASGWKARRHLLVAGMQPPIEGAEQAFVDGWTHYTAVSLPSPQDLLDDVATWQEIEPSRPDSSHWEI